MKKSGPKLHHNDVRDSHTENDYFLLLLQVNESWGMLQFSQGFIDFFENIIFHTTVIGQGSNVR